MRAYAHTRGWGTPTTIQHNHFDSEKLSQIVLVLRDLNLWSWNLLDLEADALPIEPPRPFGAEMIYIAMIKVGFCDLKCVIKVKSLIGRNWL